MDDRREELLCQSLRESLAREQDLIEQLRRIEEPGLDRRDDPVPVIDLGDPSQEILLRRGAHEMSARVLSCAHEVSAVSPAGTRLTRWLVELGAIEQLDLKAIPYAAASAAQAMKNLQAALRALGVSLGQNFRI